MKIHRKVRIIFFLLFKWGINLISVYVVDLFFGSDFRRLKDSYAQKPSTIKREIYYSYVKKHGAWIGLNSIIGSNLVLPHGIYGLFISDNAIIGSNVTIYQQVTIGSNRLRGSKRFGSPTIGDNVLIGSGAKVIGNVVVGKNSRIGANAVVVNDIPQNSLVVIGGISVIQRNEELNNVLIPV